MQSPGALKSPLGEYGTIRIRGVRQMLPREREPPPHTLAVLSPTNVRLAKIKDSKLGYPGI